MKEGKSVFGFPFFVLMGEEYKMYSKKRPADKSAERQACISISKKRLFMIFSFRGCQDVSQSRGTCGTIRKSAASLDSLEQASQSLLRQVWL